MCYQTFGAIDKAPKVEFVQIHLRFPVEVLPRGCWLLTELHQG